MYGHRSMLVTAQLRSPQADIGLACGMPGITWVRPTLQVLRKVHTYLEKAQWVCTSLAAGAQAFSGAGRDGSCQYRLCQQSYLHFQDFLHTPR